MTTPVDVSSPSNKGRKPYEAKHKIRFVSGTSLYDGHDAAINIMRRILQASGAEVIHLGHNRSAHEIVTTAIQEDVQGIALTSYQGGHLEYFKYVHDLLGAAGAGHVQIFGGGGGVILPHEIEELQTYGIARIYSPDDGRAMGLQGMINDMLERSDFATGQSLPSKATELSVTTPLQIASLISKVENDADACSELLAEVTSLAAAKTAPVLGLTGTGGSGKSSICDEIVRRFLADFPDLRLAIVSVDPSKRKTGGALLGDRIRMNSIYDERVFMRSLATRQANLALSPHVATTVKILKAAGYDLILLETTGIGQSDTEIVDHSDFTLYVMTSDYGAATQLEKIDMLDFADIIVLNKSDKRGALDALRDVRKQYRRNHKNFAGSDEELPVYSTIASMFNDAGTDRLYVALMAGLRVKTTASFKSSFQPKAVSSESEVETDCILPPRRVRYLSEISDTCRKYDQWVLEQAKIATELYQLDGAALSLADCGEEVLAAINRKKEEKELLLDRHNKQLLDQWPELVLSYEQDFFSFHVRDKEVRVPQKYESLSHLMIPKIALPKYEDRGDLLRWLLRENVPGSFPFTAGVYPFKRQGEDPTRMFAGEGGPERTNRRFHYVSHGMPAKRLSTAFDSVTLYGEDPDHRPDIYGKVGNAGVSICTLDDAKKLYSGFNLCDPMTSVSMTINGPAPMVLGFFLNAAIDQQCELYIREHGQVVEVEKKITEIYAKRGQSRPCYEGDLPQGNDGLGLLLLGVSGDLVLPADVYARIRAKTFRSVRGTVQADILKEDQAQNTCIFSTEFALRLMGDVQESFIKNEVRNFYSVSISGYHIAEAGANPVTQLALTLSNGFTYVEYYLSRGMAIDDFAPNLSFFFSNGIDPEYSVIGRVARRIWAKAMKLMYGANERSQMLKYHIQTSGRSLHAQEIDFNDIRTTLQALYAIYDNCNSLHTNAYDEAITTPTEESVRRAIAIQLIINRELGLAKNENPLQGSFIIEELTDLVEEAVLAEFDRLNDRGGVLGAMETMYQRGKIQEESLYYEMLKESGAYPIIGVNTFLSAKGSPILVPNEVIRSTEEEKRVQIRNLEAFQRGNAAGAAKSLDLLERAALENSNCFDELLEACKCCSLGQISGALYEVGGQYRRNM